jgi:putative tryptophan/tyrosine transport system substrate-binding protein
MPGRTIELPKSGFALEIDGRLKTEFSTKEGAEHGAADAIIVFGDALTFNNAARVTALAAKHRLPAAYFGRLFATNGGLMSYGPDIADLFFRAGAYVDKILTGIKPSDLPVEQPTKFELVINMKTAKALGLTVPPSLLASANEVIE